MVLRRIFRRRDSNAASALAAQLEQRGLRARALEDDGPFARYPFAPRSRLRAVVALERGPITHAALTRLDGQGVHGARVAMIGLHGFLPDARRRSAETEAPAPGGVTARRIHPRSGIGAPTDFEWQPLDASDQPALRRAEVLAADSAAHQRVRQLLKDPSTLEVDITSAPGGAVVAVYQSSRDQPDGAAIEALAAVARALAEGEGFEPPRRA